MWESQLRAKHVGNSSRGTGRHKQQGREVLCRASKPQQLAVNLALGLREGQIPQSWDLSPLHEEQQLGMGSSKHVSPQRASLSLGAPASLCVFPCLAWRIYYS